MPEVTWKQYQQVKREVDRIRQAGIYGRYILNENDEIISEISDGKYFNQKLFEKYVINPNPKYHVYFLPEQAKQEVRKHWHAGRTRAELDQRINKLRGIKKEAKDRFLLRHNVELVELLKIQEVDRAAIILEDYCKEANPVERFQEYRFIDNIRKITTRFIKKSAERPRAKKLKNEQPAQSTIEFNLY
jgi:hypothetical protein